MFSTSRQSLYYAILQTIHYIVIQNVIFILAYNVYFNRFLILTYYVVYFLIL